MKTARFILLASALLASVGCGSKGTSKFDGGMTEDDGGGGGGPCEIDPFSPECIGDDGSGEAAPPCDGLECQVVNCGTADGTTITGTVYDPAAARGLYNVYVYVPNRPLDPITSGPVCTACQAPASGKPIAAATTDFKGQFKIQNAPAGTNIPLVMQLGKWRRRINVPNVQQCQNNALTNKDQTRLPKKQAEGNADSNIPQVAFATGCDWAECFLQRTVGLDQTEFGPPGSKSRVHVYRGNDDGQQFAFTPGAAYPFWQNFNELKKYDIVFNACECSPYDRQGAYNTMKQYIDGGGRFFGTHYHYNWLAPSTGPSDYQMQAPWAPEGFNYGQVPFAIDDSFPRGKAFAEWLQHNMITQQYGQINVTDIRSDVKALNGGMKGQGMWKNTTPWIFHTTSDQTLYLSFNTPTNKVPKDQCGRAVFSDVHLSGSFSGMGSFPGYCGSNGHDVDEQALEFLFFDLSSCVQDDKSIPITPPPN